MRKGATLANRFVIEGLSRSGAMAAVFKAKDLITGKHVALKVLFGDVREQVSRFLREARILADLDHPHIVKYVTHGQTPDGGQYLAMEWLRGEDLQRHLQRIDMTVGECTRLIARVAGGLALCHEAGIVHRDLKPGNLFLKDAKPAKVKLIDFGVALSAHDITLRTDPGVTLGTPGYMAPEQAQSGMPVDHRADIFSLGCVLFRCLTGRRVFVGDSPMAVMAKTILEEAPRASQFRSNIPQDLDDLIARMLNQDPEQRPASAREVAETLHALTRERASNKLAKLRTMTALTTGEKRLLSVVMAKPPREDSAAGIPVRRLATDVDIDLAEMESVVRSFGGNLKELANGIHIITIEGVGAATDQAGRAAHAALALREAVPGMRLVLATGSGEMSARPVGEVIERAAALLRAEKNTAYVRVDSITARLLESRFDLVADDYGFTLRSTKAAFEETRTLLGRPTPCVGRVRELGFLDAIFDESADESVANAVIVSGPPGIGKSRLRYEFLLNLQARVHNLEIWFGRGDPVSSGSPFSLVAPAIRQAAGFIEGESVELRRKKLSARLSLYLQPSEIQRVATFVGELIGVRPEQADTKLLKAARLDPVLMNDQMRRAWEDLLAAELAHHPVVLLLEDLQWGDLPSVRFIDEALRNLHDRPLFVLALARPEVEDVFPTLWRERKVTKIQLQELSRRASKTLVREVLGNQLDEAAADKLVEQAAGNAFFLEELIRAVADGNEVITRLPPTVLAMSQTRIESLHPESRRILRAASIFGRAFTPSAVEQLLGGPDEAPNVGVRMARLAQDEVISRMPEPPREPGAGRIYESQYSFRHDLVRQAAYSMLTEEDRILGHRMAAEWLEENKQGDAYALADHFERGKLPARAIRYFKTAAEQALEGNDIDGALERAERGARCGATGEDLGLLRL
ncbi:MAG: protein kinase, partial [Deltaproteobacteria bacterium]|nr:protein kinase [Deltaproteobacteria bacterium]